jgi:hypothetical protein
MMVFPSFPHPLPSRGTLALGSDPPDDRLQNSVLTGLIVKTNCSGL